MATALCTGLRQGEILGLRWGDVDLERGRLRVATALQRFGGSFHLVEPKSASSRRTIPVPPPLVPILRSHRAAQARAPLRSRVPEDPEDLGLLSTLNRFPLPADGEFDKDQVVLLAQAFQVDSRHIWADAGELRLGFHLLRQVNDETRDSLLQRWAAHTARQGPLVGADNADKLAQLIKDILDDEALADELADRLTVLSGCTWEYENGPLETISTAWEAWRTTSQMPDIDALISDLNAGLSRLQSAAQQVMDALEAMRPRVPPDVTPP